MLWRLDVVILGLGEGAFADRRSGGDVDHAGLRVVEVQIGEEQQVAVTGKAFGHAFPGKGGAVDVCDERHRRRPLQIGRKPRGAAELPARGTVGLRAEDHAGSFNPSHQSATASVIPSARTAAWYSSTSNMTPLCPRALTNGVDTCSASATRSFVLTWWFMLRLRTRRSARRWQPRGTGRRERR